MIHKGHLIYLVSLKPFLPSALGFADYKTPFVFPSISFLPMIQQLPPYCKKNLQILWKIKSYKLLSLKFLSIEHTICHHKFKELILRIFHCVLTHLRNESPGNNIVYLTSAHFPSIFSHVFLMAADQIEMVIFKIV